jgi:hypothetical protein
LHRFGELVEDEELMQKTREEVYREVSREGRLDEILG